MPAVIDLPDASAFADALADRRFIAAAAISALSGFVRGFSGFGSALIYIPLIAAVYEPRIAAPAYVARVLAMAAASADTWPSNASGS